MKLIKDQKVEIIFRNNSPTITGIIVSWEKDNYILKSLDDQSLFIISKPSVDIVAIKVFLDSQSIPEKIDKVEENKKIEIDNSDLKHKKLAELYIESIKAEKQLISEKLRNHYIGNVVFPKYTQPDFIKKGK